MCEWLPTILRAILLAPIARFGSKPLNGFDLLLECNHTSHLSSIGVLCRTSGPSFSFPVATVLLGLALEKKHNDMCLAQVLGALLAVVDHVPKTNHHDMKSVTSYAFQVFQML